MATLDFTMEGVKPAGEYSELPEGEYLVRIDGTEKKAVTDKFYEDGKPSETNGLHHYLNVALQVMAGPNEGQIDWDRLNLWNTNKQTRDIALSTLKSMQDATGLTAIYDADPDYSTPRPDGTGYIKERDSDHLHGRYMMMRVKKTAKGFFKKHYSEAPENMVGAAEAVGAETVTAAAAPAVATVAKAAPAAAVHHPHAAATVAVRPAAALAVNPATANARPSWSTKK